ncbi:MAG: hypothetical protein ACLF0P_09910 [Thermoanaerobaculia bacterium]
MSRLGGRIAVAAVVAALLAGVAGSAGATEVKTFRLQSQKAFLAGTLDGLSVDPLGRLELAPRAERVTALGEPFLFDAAAHPDGWVVGTGNAGKVLLVEEDGSVRELFAASEGQVFAVLVEEDGTVWAGASPGGKVYRIPPDGEATLWYETGETYVWDLALDAEGALLVATGTSGKLFRVSEQGEGEVLYDSEDTHVRALGVLPGGAVLLGTAGEGLILRLAPDGSARTLHDADQPEVVDFAVRPDGSFFAAAIASEASAVDVAGQAQGGGGDDDQEEEEEPGEPPTAEVTVQVGPAGGAGSRPKGFQGKRSQVLAVSSAGVVAPVWAFEDETVFDVLWHRDRLWVATGLEGKLYTWDGEQMVLEKDLDERQVMAVVPGTTGASFATTNAPAVYRLTEGHERTGTFTSPALDAGAAARFGTLRWRGREPRGSEVAFSFRSGVSAEPDRTWSEWSAPSSPSPGGEVGLEGVPQGRYVQWRATLRAGGGDTASPRIDAVELSYRQENLRPRVESFEVLPPGQILVPAGFNPTLQVFEPTHPNRQGIFTTLEEASARPEGRTKKLWKKGYRAFRWSAEDPNEDELVYALHFLAGEPGDGGEWLPVAEEVEGDHLNFDATVLPDGVYRFRLTASDDGENGPGDGLTGQELSEPVVIDHAPPELVEVERRDGTLRVVVEDALNPLRSAEVSVDAGAWEPARAADGLLDARREVFEVPLPENASLVLLRTVDAAFNVVTFDLSEHAR